MPKFARALKIVATPFINLPRWLTKKAVLGGPGSDESLPLGSKSSSKFELSVMLTAEDQGTVRCLNGSSIQAVRAPYPSAALALHALASYWLVRYTALALALA